MTNTTRTVTLAAPIARKGADPITQVTINAALPAGVLPGDDAQPASTTPQVVDPRLWCVECVVPVDAALRLPLSV